MASGAAKRVSKSVVDWTKFAAVCPKHQTDMLRAVKAKHDAFINKVYTLPESLPKIDFAAYKSRLPDPAMADRFEKAYAALSIPYPVDKNNMLKQVEEEHQENEKKVKQYVTDIQAAAKESKTFLAKIESLPKFEEMTIEMYNYYFPETGYNPDRPTFWPHIEDQQPYNPDFKYYK
ncbi:ATP synthase subunit d, mitochondrial [Plakobranchus ocellatus]|uniref:ATP synthase subunit d, mitochondrial n=1 Tax=Plakobranchus ocellatus TaxID=259542 RepID=A0AAV4CMR9_9GAST|nr:ATP synthase subunit d, mitochondrial [Plakobranchus ocellatus]